jgi:hypothetical protein
MNHDKPLPRIQGCACINCEKHGGLCLGWLVADERTRRERGRITSDGRYILRTENSR